MDGLLFGLLVVVVAWWYFRGRSEDASESGRPPVRSRPAPRRGDSVTEPFHSLGSPFSLEVALGPLPEGTHEVRSSSPEGGSYLVSLAEQTCTCPDFSHRGGRPRNHFGRWCKHLVTELDRAGAFEYASEWHKAIAQERHGGPTMARLVDLKGAPSVLITPGGSDEWINVFAHSLRRGERVAQASGRITQSGWHIVERRWSYGDGPPGAGELRKLFGAIDWD